MKTDTKPIENTTENGNNSKPPLSIVAVLCLTRKDFKDFEKKNKKENEKFVWIYDTKQTYGRLFSRIEKLKNWYDMNNATEIAEALEIRLRSNS
ncbi:hypothetical protein JE952_002029 [Flavobacterium psychrophilum]|nr:hypothetical protein [Flavobacterium psychrophilum]